MNEFSNIPSNAKVRVKWKVKQYDYSLEQKNNLIAKMSEKLGIPRRHIQVDPIIIKENGEEISFSNEVISSIQRPDFQIKLFKSYLKENKIEDYDFDEILKIDAEINSNIDYKVYDNFCRYSINWIKWSNFLSYGEDNFFDFRNLKNLVLLNGKPGNTSGKTTFAIELIHFLLFGKTDKAKTLAQVFNNNLINATEVYVEGSLSIEGEEYVIRRVLTRPEAKKRTSKSKVTQKVSYYKVIGNNLEELVDVENMVGENNTQTNQAIKKVIGDESDFDMIICATSKNLNELVGKTEGERGKLFTKWIGLLPIQEKGEIAKKIFNELKTTFKSNLYNREDLINNIKTNELNMKSIYESIDKMNKDNINIQNELNEILEKVNKLNESKCKVEENLLKMDETTLKNNSKTFTENINKFKELIIKQDEELKKIVITEKRNTSELNADMVKYNKLKEETLEKRGVLLGKYSLFKKEREEFIKNGKICPTCHRPYTDAEYEKYLSEIDEKMANVVKEGNTLKGILSDCERELALINEFNVREKENLQLSLKKAALENQLANELKKLEENNKLIEQYEENKKAIDENNKIVMEINNYRVSYKDKQNTLNYNNYTIGQYNSSIVSLEKENELNNAIIKELESESKLIRNWAIYLDMVGKNGITKMVLRKTLPIINANLQALLAGVCDFNLEIMMNEKNEVLFTMFRDGIRQDLSLCGSGYEETVASLAIRAVLGKISTLPKLNFLLLDEIFATVAKENLEKVERFLRKLLTDYDFILIISHMEEISSWFDTIITVNKENGISKIESTLCEK